MTAARSILQSVRFAWTSARLASQEKVRGCPTSTVIPIAFWRKSLANWRSSRNCERLAPCRRAAVAAAHSRRHRGWTGPPVQLRQIGDFARPACSTDVLAYTLVRYVGRGDVHAPLPRQRHRGRYRLPWRVVRQPCGSGHTSVQDAVRVLSIRRSGEVRGHIEAVGERRPPFELRAGLEPHRSVDDRGCRVGSLCHWQAREQPLDRRRAGQCALPSQDCPCCSIGPHNGGDDWLRQSHCCRPRHQCRGMGRGGIRRGPGGPRSSGRRSSHGLVAHHFRTRCIPS